MHTPTTHTINHLPDLLPPPVAVPSSELIPHVLHVAKCGCNGRVVVLADKQRRGQLRLNTSVAGIEV